MDSKQLAGVKIMRIVAFTLILSSMSATMFNIVLPEIEKDFRLSFSQVSWVSGSYLLVYAIGSVIYGKLADAYKLKNLLTFGLGVFLLGSIAGLAAQSFWMVLAGRTLQAAGAAVIPASAMIIPIRYFPAESRGRALGISATGLAIGGALGPVASAAIVSVFHWRWLFCIPMLILFTLPFYRKYLDDERSASVRIDWPGGLLLAVTVGLLLLAVTQMSWMLAGAGAVMLVLFILRIRSAREPFVPAGLFRNRGYAVGLLLGAAIMGAGYALPFLTPQLLAGVNGLAPGLIGFAMVPAAAVSALLGGKGGKLADAKGNAYLFNSASALLIACFFLLSSFAGVSPVFIALVLIFGNVGQMFMQISLTGAVSRTLPKEQAGVGMGMMSMLNFMTGAAASTVYSKIVDQGASAHWNPLNAYPDSAVYSNLYLFIVLLQLGILVVYHYQFNRSARGAVQVRQHEQS